MCCSPQGRKESDSTERLNNTGACGLRSSLAARPVDFPLDTRGRWEAASLLSSRPRPHPLTEGIQSPKASSRKQGPSQARHLIHWCEKSYVC